MRIVVAIAFLLILGSLASALFFLMRDKGHSNRTVRSLMFRVGFSIALFIFIFVARFSVAAAVGLFDEGRNHLRRTLRGQFQLRPSDQGTP